MKTIETTLNRFLKSFITCEYKDASESIFIKTLEEPTIQSKQVTKAYLLLTDIDYFYNFILDYKELKENGKLRCILHTKDKNKITLETIYKLCNIIKDWCIEIDIDTNIYFFHIPNNIKDLLIEPVYI